MGGLRRHEGEGAESYGAEGQASCLYQSGTRDPAAYGQKK